ncbi:2-amino-4-hydroxy-6-hydroxymethyldihydropteridine diphosphokinase [Paenisporosarcina cavernae]|uniref:2-amino-4-hydroxy-6-hydroxymethyldihydropteridine diphosphokinase n=1 Tax=Paenisporosarcina cavernae TaxID=2320858 RepID=A0A385YZ91_9BACL|nr:2-amino-4-hydroxy-6-hydroxymethyldihydropteridine diphosphokinase [Paenisporosarcina cavernae]AYC30672.1 2-amino-4-hydroxy-6-hydroxymethyldihydropteridine diphosphokinase [Paenisporosarcina cavernae]
MNTAFLSLGTNMGDREGNLREALRLLTKTDHLHVKKMSSIYETAPVGYLDQGSFLNCVVQVECEQSADELLEICMQVEQTLGRVRDIRWGPRCIDLDILLFNHDNIESEKLIIPHPRMHERGFVLVPLVEIDPQGVHPVLQRSLQDLVKQQREGIQLWKQVESVEEFVHFGN